MGFMRRNKETKAEPVKPKPIKQEWAEEVEEDSGEYVSEMSEQEQEQAINRNQIKQQATQQPIIRQATPQALKERLDKVEEALQQEEKKVTGKQARIISGKVDGSTGIYIFEIISNYSIGEVGELIE